MFEGFIRNGHAGELALDDIRLGTDIPLENCMGTCRVWLQGPGMAGGTAGDGEPSLTGCQWATSPLLELPGVSGCQLGLSLPMKEMKGTQSLGDGGSGCVVRGRKHMSAVQS